MTAMGRITARATIIGIAISAGLVGCQSPAESPEPHPIIIVNIDTLRADHLGLYGYKRPTSPRLDAFAQEAIVFEWAFSQAPNTPPSQTSILTGLYPSTHGMVQDEDKVPDEAVTLAEALKEHGFTTVAFHDGGYMSNAFNMGQGFETYDNNKGKGLASIGPKAISWLREHHQEPFLLMIHTYDVHTPYAPPAPFDGLFLEGLAEPTPGFEPTSQQLEEVRLSKYTDTLIQLADNDLEYAKALYDGGIRYVDEWFGEFMEVIRELELDQRAVIVVISDHGEEFQEHGSVLHEKLYATVTHVPWMIRLPRGRSARRVDRVVETIDLLPTLLSLVGAPIPDGVQGASLVPWLEGSGEAGPEVAFGESPFFGERRFVATPEYRLLLTVRDQSSELYRYREDPLEQNDLAMDLEAKTETLEQLLSRWEVAMSATGALSSSQTEELDSETLDELRALGYIQ